MRTKDIKDINIRLNDPAVNRPTRLRATAHPPQPWARQRGLARSPRIGQHAHLSEFYYTIVTNVEAIIAFWDDVQIVTVSMEKVAQHEAF